MGYLKANAVLPEEVLKLVQEYVDGEYLYIPRVSGNEKAWGERTGTRKSLGKRNSAIYHQYKNGTDISDLAKQYYLSEKSIRRIIHNEKRAS